MPNIDRRELVAIIVGGLAGALIRIELGRLVPTAPGDWPWATFAVNIAGAFLLGYASVAAGFVAVYLATAMVRRSRVFA